MAEAAVEARGLRKEYGNKIAVEDLTLSVPRGEVFGLLGANGAGKTTAIKMFLGLVHPTAGSGHLLGVPLGQVAVRGRVGYLPEHFRFHDWLTGRELLELHGRLYEMQPMRLAERIHSLLSRLDLLEHASRKLADYSKGLLQRIGLAQALLNTPELIFLDEPTSALDPLGRFLVRDLIREQRERGATVFLNSHLLGEVEATCDRVAFVREGRVVQEMTLAEQDRSLDLELRLEPVTPELLEGLARFGRQVRHENGSLVKLRVEGEAQIPALARWLVGRDVALYRLAARPHSLEELFVEVLGDR